MATVHYPVSIRPVHQNVFRTLIAQPLVESAVRICVIKNLVYDHKSVRIPEAVVTKEVVR